MERLDPIFKTLAPGRGDIPRTPGREKKESTAEHGYLHCGPAGAGHFVKMIHNGIEYGLMAAYGEGLNILKNANVGKAPPREGRGDDTAAKPRALPVRLRPRGRDRAVAARQRRHVLAPRPHRAGPYRGSRASTRSGERSPTPAKAAGRWTAANDEGVPAHVLTAALFERFASRGQDLFQNKVLSAMRYGFGGHVEKK